MFLCRSTLVHGPYSIHSDANNLHILRSSSTVPSSFRAYLSSQEGRVCQKTCWFASYAMEIQAQGIDFPVILKKSFDCLIFSFLIVPMLTGFDAFNCWSGCYSIGFLLLGGNFYVIRGNGRTHQVLPWQCYGQGYN